MARSSLRFDRVSFSYDSLGDDLVVGLSCDLPLGWTGVVGANGSGKTTLLKLATGDLAPTAGSVVSPGPGWYCAQRTDDPPPELAALLAPADGRAAELVGRLALGEDWPGRWDTLSHGERKRAQLAVALWRAPALLAVDEPTNHLDAGARDLLAAALRGYRGVGLLVSHDRVLLDTLCDRCFFLEPPAATLRPGGYTAGRAAGEDEEKHRRRRREAARRERDHLKRERTKRRDLASRAHQRRSKRNTAPKDHDAKSKIDAAIVSGRDKRAGDLLRQLDGRMARAEDELAAATVRKDYALGIWQPGEVSRRATLLRLPAGELVLGAGRVLAHPDLELAPADRVALTGPNGGGKTTLLTHLLPRLNLEAERQVVVPQEIARARSQEIVAAARALPKAELGRLMQAVSRLGSRPERLLATELPSPGELRKLLLATGIARTPHLIVMDEPTNHLDLPSIECLEQALADCPCALLLVSHDRPFLEKLTTIEWRIGEGVGGYALTVGAIPG